MSSYEVKNLEWVRGSTPAFRFKFRRVVSTPPDVFEGIVFDDARFTVWSGAKNGAFLFRYSVATSEITITDADQGQIDFVVTAADTRSCLPSNIGEAGKNRYELELRNGASERVYLLGIIAAVGGINDDEG